MYRKSKYGNKKTTIDGITFDSKRESERYCFLKYRLLAKEIKELELQPKFPIFINEIKVFTYKADFAYIEKGKRIVEDSKGFRTSIFKLKKKAVEAYYGIEIIEV